MNSQKSYLQSDPIPNCIEGDIHEYEPFEGFTFWPGVTIVGNNLIFTKKCNKCKILQVKTFIEEPYPPLPLPYPNIIIKYKKLI